MLDSADVESTKGTAQQKLKKYVLQVRPNRCRKYYRYCPTDVEIALGTA